MYHFEFEIKYSSNCVSSSLTSLFSSNHYCERKKSTLFHADRFHNSVFCDLFISFGKQSTWRGNGRNRPAQFEGHIPRNLSSENLRLIRLMHHLHPRGIILPIIQQGLGPSLHQIVNQLRPTPNSVIEVIVAVRSLQLLSVAVALLQIVVIIATVLHRTKVRDSLVTMKLDHPVITTIIRTLHDVTHPPIVILPVICLIISNGTHPKGTIMKTWYPQHQPCLPIVLILKTIMGILIMVTLRRVTLLLDTLHMDILIMDTV